MLSVSENTDELSSSHINMYMKVYEILSETTTLQEGPLATVIKTGRMAYQVMGRNGVLDPKVFRTAKGAIEHKSRFYMTKAQRDAKIAAKKKQGAGGEKPYIKGAENKISPLGRAPNGKIYTTVDGQRRYYSSYADYFRKSKIWGPGVAAASKRTAAFWEKSWVGSTLLGLGANLTVPILEWRSEVDAIHAGYVNGEFDKAEAEHQIKYITDLTIAKFVTIFLSLGAARLVAKALPIDKILTWVYGRIPGGSWIAALDKPATTLLVQSVFMKEPIVEDIARAALRLIYEFTPYAEYSDSFWNQLFQVTGYEMVNGELDKQRIARTGSTAGIDSGTQTKPPVAKPEDDNIDFGVPGTANRLIKKLGLD